MNKYEIVFSKEAKEDLINIVKYISECLQEPNIAIRLSNRIKDRINNIAENPKIYAIIDDNFIKKLKLRKVIVDRYIIFYRTNDEEKQIQIARVMYGRRNWRNLLSV